MTNDFFINIPDYSGIGIYALINNRTGKMYVGASQNIHQRIMQHKYHPLSAIKDDIELGDTFRVEILEKLPSGSNQFDMFGREKYFIDLYDVIKHGYNKAPTTCCPKEELLKTLEHCTPNTQMATYISNIIDKRERPIYTHSVDDDSTNDIPSKSTRKAKYDIQYAKSRLKRIPLDVQKEEYEQIKAAADAADESVNGYIKQAIRQRMQRDAE